MFKPGDKLKRNNANWQGLKLENYPALLACDAYTVTKYNTDVVYPTVSFEETGTTEWDASFFELVDPISKIKSISEGLEVFSRQENIAKPILEERKIGKIKMHLVDEGFPNAMMELGKMMGWAEEHKGYKPNDFKNLPNAEVEFSAAATRHRLKGFIQKAEGVPAIDRIDEESGISHLCHAAFNILAELELVLMGRIK